MTSRLANAPNPLSARALQQLIDCGGHPDPRIQSSASAAAPSRARSLYEEESEYVSFTHSSSNPPTRAQLAALTAVPSHMVQRGAKQGKGKSKKNRRSLAKFYNMVAGRPYPRLTSLEQKIQVCLTTNIAGAISSGTTGDSFYAKAFSLNDFAGSTSYLTVFDQYRFDQLEVWLEPANGTTSDTFYPLLITCVDLDDANLPSTINQVEDHQQSLSGEGQAGRYHKWNPHMAVAAYSGAFTSYKNEPAGWIDSASPSVQHYGFKAATYSNGFVWSYQLTVRALISFRAPGIN